MILGSDGYEAAVNGSNGFVCEVERGWMSPFDSPEFWNPKMRGPICFNPQAARSILPITIERTKLVLAGRTKDQIMADIRRDLDSKKLPHSSLERCPTCCPPKATSVTPLDIGFPI
jgi:hypothetical protein